MSTHKCKAEDAPVRLVWCRFEEGECKMGADLPGESSPASAEVGDHLDMQSEEPLALDLVKIQIKIEPVIEEGGAASSASSAGDLLETTIEKIKKRAALATTSPISIEHKQLQLTKELPRIAPKPSNSSKKQKKDRSPQPEDSKDQHYWEMRRKNNEAAKRCRDSRRAKEDQIAK
jgi:hypothetical protein